MTNIGSMDQSVKYIDDNKILVRSIRGKADFEEIFDSWKDLINEDYFAPPVIGMINDYCGAELKVDISDMKKIKVLLEDYPDIFKSVKIAVVVDSFKNIVYPMIVEKVSEQANVRPFSTVKAARDWILDIID